MELLLWLYLFDNRWFFNIQIPIDIYKHLWIIPLSFHLIESSIATYYYKLSTEIPCFDSIKSWLSNRCIFCIMISLNIIFFIQKLSIENEKEKEHLHMGKKAYPILKSKINEHDFWVRRNSLLSKTGVLLLFQGLISFIWAYFLQKQFNDNNYNSCDINIKPIIQTHSLFILFADMFVLIVFAILIITKIIFNVLGHYFPTVFIMISKICHRKNSNIYKYHKNSNFKKLD